MKNPLRKKSTLEKTVEDPPRALKSGLVAIVIIVGIILVSVVASKAVRNGQEPKPE